jgi:hypothetical protein
MKTKMVEGRLGYHEHAGAEQVTESNELTAGWDVLGKRPWSWERASGLSRAVNPRPRASSSRSQRFSSD